MLKKKLLEQNTQIYNSLKQVELENEELKQSVKQKEEIILKLEREIDSLKANVNATEPLKELESKVIKINSVSEDVNYGASVIGKIVVEAAKACNNLTSKKSDNTKELINLILGRTEVAKSEILKAIESKMDKDQKISLIDLQYEESKDYFDSILAQI